MDYESLFAQTRWQILTLLAEKPASPLEIAKHLGATISHVSQQLKFLEAMGLVGKEKIINRDKGKPRMLFSLVRDFAHISVLIKGLSQKKLLHLTEHQKTILRIWFLEPHLHYSLEKFYWEIEPYLQEVKSMFSDRAGNIFVIVGDVSSSRISSFLKKFKEKVDFTLLNEKSFAKLYSKERHHLFFGSHIIEDKKEVKS